MEISARVRDKENMMGRPQWVKAGGNAEDEFFQKVVRRACMYFGIPFMTFDEKG